MMNPWGNFRAAAAVAAGVIAGVGVPASAEASCSALEVRFNPQGVPGMGGREPLSPQIAVWLEDKAGNFVADSLTWAAP